MLQTSLIYFAMWLLFQILVDCQTIPKQRQWHTATHIDNKLYILGGLLLNNRNFTDEFFYLDVSDPFNTKTLSWQDLSGNTIPAHAGAAAVAAGANNNTLFLYGGFTTNATSSLALVYEFDPISKTWTPHYANNSQTADKFRRALLTGINNKGNMYLWGGETSNLTDSNDMFILDTIGLILNEKGSDGAPPARFGYGAVLLLNQNIIYFGKLLKPPQYLIYLFLNI